MISHASSTRAFTQISYAQCWEDADVLLEALDVEPGQICLSIASAGDNTLALLTRSPGKVIAVDHNPLQLYCLELRMAAYKALSHKGLLELIGSRPSSRRRALYQQCRSHLSPDAREFWDAHQEFVMEGIGAVGRFERYIALFRKGVMPWLLSRQAVNLLLEGGPIEWRKQQFERLVNTWCFNSAFRLFFSRFLMGRMGRHPNAFRFAEGSVSKHLLGRVRWAFTELDPVENPYLQWILTGRHTSALPCALREENFDMIRDNLDRVELRCQPVTTCLEGTGNREINRYNLSNILEYLSEEESAALFDEVARTACPGGRAAYWNTIVPRFPPERLHDRIHPLDDIAARLYQRDKAFFYGAFRLERIAG